MTKFPFEVVAVVLLLSCTVLIIADAQISKEDPIDPCNKPEYCTEETKAADPEDCARYYWCVTGNWMRMNCSTGTLFDNVTLECIHEDQANCQPECPPFTGSTTIRVTLQPGTCENITQCLDGQKYPDRSNCESYYLCNNGQLVHQSCPPGTVFDIYVAECVAPDSDFDCYYRCVTPAPTTDVPATVTSGSTTEWTTTGFVTSASSTSSSPTSVSIPPTTTNPGGSGSDSSTTAWTTAGFVTSGSSTSSSSTSVSISSTTVSISSTTTNTDGSGSGNEAVLIGIIIGILVLIILIVIIIIVVCMKKHRKNKVDPENCCSSFFHRVHLYVVTGKSVKKREQARRITVKDVHLMGVVTTVSVDHSNPILLSPVLLAAGDPERTTDFDHSAFVTKAEKDKRKRLKRFKRIDPSRERQEAIKAAKKYKKKLREDLHLRYEAEEKHENAYYDDKVDLLNNDALAKRQKFRSDLRSASDRNDPTELTALANNHVNSQHANTNARQEVLNGRDEMLRTRLKDMHLTQTDMLTAGLLASDLDGSDVAMRIRKFNKQQEKMKESYLQEFTSKANSGASLADLEKLTESYESQMATLQENHLQERNQASQRLLKAIVVMALQKLDKLWEQECQKVDQAFDYSATSDADPSLVKVTLTEHLEALKKAGENIDSHITNRNLSAAVVAATNLEHGSETSASLPNGHATMETSATSTQPLPLVPLPAETMADRNDDTGELPDAAGVNGIGGRSMAQTSETLAEEQRRIMILHQQRVEQIQAMRTREKSKMDELLMKKLSERRTGAGVSSADM